jgi:hypothetical protein
MPDVSDLTDKLRESLESLGPAIGSEPTLLNWHESTHEPWSEICEALDRERDGLRARLKPNIMRVAMLYALSVGARSVMLPHLVAAKAFVLQCSDSAASVYPQRRSASPTRLQSRVQAVATNAPKTLNDFHAGLHRTGYKADDLRAALSELVADGELTQTTVASKKGDPLPAWSLASKGVAPEIEEPQSQIEEQLPDAEEPLPEPTPVGDASEETPQPPSLVADGVIKKIEVQGMELDCITRCSVKKTAHALRIGGGLTVDGVKKDEEGFVVCASRGAPSHERTHKLITRAGYVAVMIGDQLLHVKREHLRFEKSEPVAA